jgi:hypothetical protein
MEGTLSGEHRNSAQSNLDARKMGGLAPAKGILLGLALSMLFWIIVVAVWCF